MPRNREPINLLLIKGRKHLSKAEIQERKESEVQAPADRVAPPKYLPRELKSDFKKIAAELMRVDLFSNLDIDTLARFLIAREQYERTVKEMRAIEDITLDVVLYSKLLNANNTLFNQCRAAASDLGLSITARARLLVPKKKKDEPSEFEQKFGGV